MRRGRVPEAQYSGIQKNKSDLEKHASLLQGPIFDLKKILMGSDPIKFSLDSV